MASIFRKAMVYLGLDDDEYHEYESYNPADGDPGRAANRDYNPNGGAYSPRDRVQGPAADRTGAMTLSPEVAEPTLTSVRAIPRDDPAGVGPVIPRGAVVRPLVPEKGAKVNVVAPARFSDAKEIGDNLRSNQPVIVNLQVVDRDLSRRMIDFCSGVTYGLGGSMDKVADQVFLLTPSNVEVSAEEKQRLSERGLYQS
ncbi:MAG: cell division protein SepF [Acidimicrobiales bacterium]